MKPESIKQFSNSDIERIREATIQISALFSEFDSNDHALESSAIGDRIVAHIRPQPGVSLINLAHDIVDGQIEDAIEEFTVATEGFYNGALRSETAAQSTDRVLKLNHDRNELSRSPSIELARELQSVFGEFLAAQPATNNPQ